MKYSISAFLVFLCLVTILSRNLNKSNADKSLYSNKQVILVDAPVVSEVSTLVEYPVTASTSIAYYYPYFYKTHLITFSDEIDTALLITSCPDNGCGWCDPLSPVRCMKCSVGYFLSGQTCVTFCPEGYVTDILRFRCVAVSTVTSTEVVYTKAYSFGSCQNSCGKTMSDCSCQASCKNNGNCCTDYDLVSCEGIIAKNGNVNEKDCKANSNCLYCDDKQKLEDIPRCNQCKDKFYLHEGSCYEYCPESTITDSVNMICKKKPTCIVENCESCGFTGRCNQCKRGFFLYNGECFQKCPSGYRADRITWTCLEPPVFAWYWVYPSRSSCKNYCGVLVQEWDCSCADDCFLLGNCCQDIEYVCPSILFWRKKGVANTTTAPAKKKLPINNVSIKPIQKQIIVKTLKTSAQAVPVAKKFNTK